MNLVSYEYVSVKDWCRSVEAANLLNEAGNRVYFRRNIPPQPSIDVLGLRARGNDFAGLAAVEHQLLAYVDNFDPQTRAIQPPSAPFVAKLENVRIEYPGFGIFVDQHLLLAESYHGAEYTTAVMGWHGKAGLRRNVRVRVEFDTEAGFESKELNSMYFIDRGTDQYCDEPAILLSGIAARNYHHWLIEILPKLWCVDAIPELGSVPLMVRAPVSRFQLETLVALGIPRERLRLFTGNVLAMKTLIFPSPIVPGNYSAQVVAWLRTKLLPVVGGPPAKAKGLVYVSRSKATRRRVLNEDQLIPKLEARGFRVYFLEDMPVKQQLETFSNAKMVVMPHGAAGVNIVFAQPGCVFIEMVPVSYQHFLDLIYASLNNCIYGAVLCDDSTSQQTQDMVADVDKLLNVVDRALETLAPK